METAVQTAIIAGVVGILSSSLTFVVARKDVLTKGLHILIDSLQEELDRLKNEVKELRDREGSWGEILKANIQLAKSNAVLADKAAEYEARGRSLEKALRQAEADADRYQRAGMEAQERFDLLFAHSSITPERFEQLWKLHKS